MENLLYLLGACLIGAVVYRMIRFESLGTGAVGIGLIAAVVLAIPTFPKIGVNLPWGGITLDQCEDVLAKSPPEEASETIARATRANTELRSAVTTRLRIQPGTLRVNPEVLQPLQNNR